MLKEQLNILRVAGAGRRGEEAEMTMEWRAEEGGVLGKGPY